MPISESFWIEVSPSDFPHERRGLEWLRENLPGNRGLLAFTNFTFDADGTSNEIDLAVVGPGGFVLVELKDYAKVRHEAGRFHGISSADCRAWRQRRQLSRC